MREADIELGEQDWDERRNINKRKKIILQGKNPEKVAKAKKAKLEAKRKRAKQERQENKKGKVLSG